MSIPVNQLGWVAGIIDAKGKIIRKRNRSRATPQIVLSVEMKEYDVVRALCRLTGTRAELQAPQQAPEWMRRGCREHCPDKHNHVGPYGDGRMPPIARWTITGGGAAVVLWNVSIFLQTDRGWAEAMEETIRNTPHGGQGFASVARSLRRLQELGWEFPPEFVDLDLDNYATQVEEVA